MPINALYGQNTAGYDHEAETTDERASEANSDESTNEADHSASSVSVPPPIVNRDILAILSQREADGFPPTHDSSRTSPGSQAPEGQSDDGGTLDTVKTVLDVAGFVPGIGTVANLASAGISVAQGKYGEAALSAAAAIPVVGMLGEAAKGAKLAGKGIKAGEELVKGGKSVVKAGEQGEKAAATVERAAAHPGEGVVEEAKLRRVTTEEPKPAAGSTQTAQGTTHAVDRAGGTGKVSGPQNVPSTNFSGHGSWDPKNGTFTVPAGASVTVFSEHGGKITDELGNLIETDGDTSKVFSRTYHAGSDMPNYTLEAPVGLTIKGSPTTVTKPTLLSDLVKPGMGNCKWAACTYDPKGPAFNQVFSSKGVIAKTIDPLTKQVTKTWLKVY